MPNCPAPPEVPQNPRGSSVYVWPPRPPRQLLPGINRASHKGTKDPRPQSDFHLRLLSRFKTRKTEGALPWHLCRRSSSSEPQPHPWRGTVMQSEFDGITETFQISPNPRWPSRSGEGALLPSLFASRTWAWALSQVTTAGQGTAAQVAWTLLCPECHHPFLFLPSARWKAGAVLTVT